MNVSIAAALKPSGRAVVVDFTPPGKEATRPEERGTDGKDGVQADTVTREMMEAGFELVLRESPPQRWFVVVFSKSHR